MVEMSGPRRKEIVVAIGILEVVLSPASLTSGGAFSVLLLNFHHVAVLPVIIQFRNLASDGGLNQHAKPRYLGALHLRQQRRECGVLQR